MNTDAISSPVTKPILYAIERPYPSYNIIIGIFKNKSRGVYQFVNITTGHIYEKGYDSIEEAINDLNNNGVKHMICLS